MVYNMDVNGKNYICDYIWFRGERNLMYLVIFRCFLGILVSFCLIHLLSFPYSYCIATLLGFLLVVGLHFYSMCVVFLAISRW